MRLPTARGSAEDRRTAARRRGWRAHPVNVALGAGFISDPLGAVGQAIPER